MRRTDELTDLADRITHTLLRVINRIQSSSRSHRIEGMSSLTLIEAEICQIISGNDGVTASELSNMLGVSRSAVSQVASRLRVRGYIREEQDEFNAKRKHLYLTALGSSAADILTMYTRAMTHALYDGRLEELEAYLRFVTKLERFHDSIRVRSSTSPGREAAGERRPSSRTPRSAR